MKIGLGPKPKLFNITHEHYITLLIESERNIYSFLKAFTGLVEAARSDSKLMVIMAINNALVPANRNTEKSRGVL